MANNSLANGNVLCKYDEYLEPNLKRTSYDMPFVTQTKKRSMHKHRLSSILPPPTINKNQEFLSETLPEKCSKKVIDEPQNRNPTLLSRKNYQQKKQQIIRLEKLFPKSVTIKFEQVLDTIPNNRKKQIQSRSPKMGKTISPFKIFQMAENRFYVDLFNQKQRQQEEQKENQSTRNNIDTLFNVRSIKMIKKIVQTLPFRDEKAMINSMTGINDEKKTRKKYEKMFKKETDFSVEYEKENPPKMDRSQKSNMKLSLRNFRQFEELQSSSSKSHTKLAELKPLSELKNRQDKKNQRLSSKNPIIMTQYKPQNANSGNHLINRSTSMMITKRKKSKELTPMIFSMNNDSINSLLPNISNNKFMSRKFDSIFDEKITKYLTMLKMNASILGIDINFPDTYSRNQFCFYVGNGNNSKLVKQMLKKRWWLGSCEDKKDLQRNNIIWTQLKDKAYYLLNDNINKKQIIKESLLSSEENKQSKQILPQQPKRLIIHNHFQQNEFLGNKKALFYNMKAYYESQSKNVFDYLPLTFHITSLSDQSWTSFVNEFNKIKQIDPTAKNIWILKPGENSNRGNGITVHESIDSTKSILSQAGERQKFNRTYILQKYIQKPFLYNKRKFDIRCYMLLVRMNQTIKGFWYKEGYIRTSCYEFTLEDCDNSFVHLTNDAIQQNCDNYGKYEDKNKLSYETFQKYLDTNCNVSGEGEKKYDLEKHILPKLRTVCIDSIKACSKSIGKWKEGLPTFQLFGLDFMIDEQFNPWLIEINTNPCLETQGRVLEKVIVPLLDNVFKITIDCFIPPPLNWSNSNKHLLSKNCDKNLFQLVFDQALQEKNSQKTQQIKDLPLHMIGQIDEDNEVYEE